MAIVFILILGFVLRLVNLNQSLWLDETVQAITSRGTFLGIFSELQGDFHPPLYHLLMWGWTHLFGSGEIAMRLPSVFFGTAAIFMVYKIAQRIFPQKNWLWLVAALFMATAPFHIYYSQEARMYAQTTFFAALSTYFFLGLIGKEKGNRAGYLFSTLLLFYSDYYGLLVFLAQILAALVIFKKDFFKFLFKLWSTFLLIVVLFLPCLPLLWVQLQTGSQATFALPQWGRLVNLSFLKALPLTFIKFSLGRITIFNKSLYAAVFGFLLITYGLLFVKGFWSKKKLVFNNDQKVILFWLLVPIVLAWLIAFFIPNYQPFRLLLILPAFYLLLILGIAKIENIKIRIVSILFVLLVNLISLSVYFDNPFFHREDWKGAVAFIEKQGENNSLALLPSQTSFWPWEYYAKDKVQLITVAQGFNIVQAEDLKNLEVIKDKDRVYFIYYLADVFDPQNLIPNWLEEENFDKIREVSFNQIRIQEWQKK